MELKVRTKMFGMLTCMLICLTALIGCSSDNEPDYPLPDDDIESFGMIDYKILPGNWILESVTESETGETTDIGLSFTIFDFEPTQDTDLISIQNGYEIWAKTYDPLTSSDTADGVLTANGIIGYYKKRGSSINSSKITNILFTLHVSEKEIIVVNGSDLIFKDNILTCVGCCVKEITISPISGTIRLRKV